MMSSSPTSPPGPLTTIFTPPTGCFDHFPQVWDYCGGKVELEIFYTERCFWSLAEHCYPTGAQISSSSFEGGNGTLYPIAYTYSPGVLPSGFTGLAEGDDGWLTGCISGWNPNGVGWCTSSISSASHVLGGYTHSEGFMGLVPKIVVSWASEDLSLFTPASAPVLPTATLEKYELSVSAHSRSAAVVKATETTTQTMQKSPHSTVSPPPTNQGSKLSKGDIAAIIVCVMIGVVGLSGFIILRWWRKRKRLEEVVKLQRTDSERPYVDNKSELPSHGDSKEISVEAAECSDQDLQELPADSQPQEIAAEVAPQELSADREPESDCD